jgi:hypothetical protein
MQLTEEDFGEFPDRVIVDPESGWAINVALNKQNYPGWWKAPDEQATVERIMALRRELGIPAPEDEALS